MLKNILIRANFIYVYLLLLIWVLPHTIALRNIILSFGVFTFLLAIYKFPNYYKIPISWALIPLFLICTLFIWTIVHYLYFSYDQTLEFDEIKSIWLRSFFGCCIAYFVGETFKKNNPNFFIYKNLFFIFLLAVPIENLSMYLHACYENGKFISPQFYVGNYLFKKIETTFFGSIAMAIYCSQIKYCWQSSNFKGAFYFSLAIPVIFISGIISNSKNATIINIFILFVLLLLIMVGGMRNRRFNLKFFFPLVAGVFISAIVIGTHLKYASPGWLSLGEDIKTSLDVDRHTEWRDSVGAQELPKNEYGEYVSGSTYLRVAWAVVGYRLIDKHPAGYGSINRSFDLLLKHDGVPHWSNGQTHSGWVDFGLAYGKLGLAILFFCILFIVGRSLCSNSSGECMAGFIGIVLLVMPIIAETTWKQYFEAKLFFLTLAAVLITRTGKRGKFDNH